MVRETVSFPEDGPVEPERADVLSKAQVTLKAVGSEEAPFAKSWGSEWKNLLISTRKTTYLLVEAKGQLDYTVLGGGELSVARQSVPGIVTSPSHALSS